MPVTVKAPRPHSPQRPEGSAGHWSARQLADLAGRLAASGQSQPLRSPFDGRLLAEPATSTSADVGSAAARARTAQLAWAAAPVEQRMEVLLTFHDRLLERRDAMVELLQREAGKSRLSASEEVLHVALTARYYGRTAARHLRPARRLGMFPLLTRVEENYRPTGLVGVIAPWNYPLSIAMSDGLAALVAGNAVLLKPDEQTPLVIAAVVELLEGSGLPQGLCQVIHGAGAEVGRELVQTSDYVCFTGSSATGRTVAAQCAARLVGCSLELGGKNPMLVLDDADVDRAADGAVRASFSHAGQLCLSSERIFVAAPLMDRFCAAFSTRTEAIRLGNTLDFSSDMGSLVNAGQLERVSAHVEDARAHGATVLTGGRRRPDLGELFYEPTILTGVTPAMRCCTEETFGPVVSVYAVGSDEEAVARANDSSYGLNASVWTSDAARGRHIAARIACGSVNVNEAFVASYGSIDAPMGGMKQSGLGRRHGQQGIRRFVEVQTVATQSLVAIGPRGTVSAGPYVAMMTGAVRLLKRLGRP